MPLRIKSPDGTWIDAFTTGHSVKLKMPDGMWRTFYAHGSGTELRQKQPDGTWVTVAYSVAGAVTGSLTGVVTLEGRGPLAGVSIVEASSGRSTTTDSSGHYTLTGVPLGERTFQFYRGQGEPINRTVTLVGDSTTLNLEMPIIHGAFDRLLLMTPSNEQINNKLGWWVYNYYFLWDDNTGNPHPESQHPLTYATTADDPTATYRDLRAGSSYERYAIGVDGWGGFEHWLTEGGDSWDWAVIPLKELRTRTMAQLGSTASLISATLELTITGNSYLGRVVRTNGPGHGYVYLSPLTPTVPQTVSLTLPGISTFTSSTVHSLSLGTHAKDSSGTTLWTGALSSLYDMSTAVSSPASASITLNTIQLNSDYLVIHTNVDAVTPNTSEVDGGAGNSLFVSANVKFHIDY